MKENLFSAVDSEINEQTRKKILLNLIGLAPLMTRGRRVVPFPKRVKISEYANTDNIF